MRTAPTGPAITWGELCARKNQTAMSYIASMQWVWSDHILRQMRERGIERSEIESALNEPEETVPGTAGRVIYHKLRGGRLLRVVTEDAAW